MQTSEKKLSYYRRNQLFNRLVTVLADLQNPTETDIFLKDFFGETELTVYIKRLTIAWMLGQHYSYEKIKKQLNVSSATISSVADQVNKPGFQLALQKISRDQQLNQAAEKIRSWLAKLGI